MKQWLKKGLPAIGITSVLLLILGMPILIWSNPWSINGTYHSLDGGDDVWLFLIFENGQSNLFGSTQEGVFNFESLQYTKSDGVWSVYSPLHKRDYDITFTNNGLTRIEYTNKKSPYADIFSINFIKPSNPFTIWRIKWLEWTAK